MKTRKILQKLVYNLSLNGLIDKKKYELIFDLDNNRVNEILSKEKEFEKFSDNLKTKIF